MNYLYTDSSTQKLLLCYCNNVAVPKYLHEEIWMFWKSVMSMWPCQIQGNLLSWFCCVVYKFVDGKELLQHTDDYYVHKDLTVYTLCQQACISFPNFLTKLAEYETVLQTARSSNSLILMKKYLTSLLISEHHDQLCKQLFVEGHSGYLENKQFIWLLFLVAKSLNLGCPQSFLQHYNIYLCCLSYGISLIDLELLKEPLFTVCSVATDVNAYVYEILCIALKLPLCRFIGVYKDTWIPFRTLLQQICHFSKADLVQYMISKYDASFANSNDFHEVLFLENDPILCLSETQQQNNTYRVSISFQTMTLEEIAQDASCNLTKELKSNLSNCSKYSEKKFMTKVSAFQSWFVKVVTEKLDANMGELSKYCSLSVKLYLLKLQHILKAEELRLQQKDFSLLFLNQNFHKSLFVLSVAVILHEEDEDAVDLIWLADALEVKTVHLHAILESFLLHEPFLPPHVTKFVMMNELKLLTEHAWNEAEVYEYFDFDKAQCNFSMDTDYLCDRSNEKDYNFRAKYFISRLRRALQCRLLMFCDALGFDDSQFMFTWPCLEHAIFYKHELSKGRNLDQLMLCAVYAISKVTDREVQFRRLIDCYKNLKFGSDMIFKCVFIGGRHYDSIITFYNVLFMPMLKDFVLRFGLYLKEECIDSSTASMNPALQKLRGELSRRTYWYS